MQKLLNNFFLALRNILIIVLGSLMFLGLVEMTANVPPIIKVIVVSSIVLSYINYLMKGIFSIKHPLMLAQQLSCKLIIRESVHLLLVAQQLVKALEKCYAVVLCRGSTYILVTLFFAEICCKANQNSC